MSEQSPSDGGAQVQDRPRRPARIDRKAKLAAAGLLLLAFLIAGRLYTWHNGFSYRFHPDEITKARQIQAGVYNFYHPQLLLRGTQALLLLRTGAIDGRIDNEPRDKLEVPLYNRILINARTASAVFAAGAVVLLALTAFAQRAAEARTRDGSSGEGMALCALVLVAASVVACPSLLVNAHFAKEDAALVMGVAAWVTMGAWFARRPESTVRMLALAAACGMVTSAKWIGAALAGAGVVGILIISWRTRRLLLSESGKPAPEQPGTGQRRRSRLGVSLALLVLGAVVLLINAPLLWQFDNLVDGLRYEAKHVTSDHQGLIATIPPLYYVQQLIQEAGWGLVLLAGVELAATAVAGRQRRRLDAWVVPLAVAVLFATICSTRIVNPRYLLPVTVLVHYLAALGALRIAETAVVYLRRGRESSLRGCWPAAAGGIALVMLGFLLAPQVMRQRDMLWHFGHDHRDALQRWAADPTQVPSGARVLEAIPAEAKLLQESYVALERWALPFESHTVRSVAFRAAEEPMAADSDPGIRTPADLAGEGYTHIAIAEDRWSRFFDPRLQPVAEYAGDYRQIREIYEGILRQEGVRLIYEYKAAPNRPDWINPSIRIYRLTASQQR